MTHFETKEIYNNNTRFFHIREIRSFHIFCNTTFHTIETFFKKTRKQLMLLLKYIFFIIKRINLK